MAAIRALLLLTFTVFLCDHVLGQGDSLRSALTAFDRRQKDLSDYEDEYGYSIDSPEDIAFLNNPSDHTSDKGDLIGRPLLEYLDDDPFEPTNKRVYSAFRERLEEDKQNKMDDLIKNLLVSLQGNAVSGDNDNDYLQELWTKYYYPNYNVENVGLRKRGRFVENNDEPLYTVHHHVPRDDGTDYQMNHFRNRYFQRSSGFSQPHRLRSTKRFSVTKRSSNNYIPGEQKRSVKKQTDPKVEKDLRNIFGKQKTELNNNKNKNITDMVNQTPDKNKTTTDINKEVFSPVTSQNDKPIQAEKKSINWSDYFGFDRRKKSENSELDKESLMRLLDRYHKAVAITAKKRNAELPLQSFKNHEQVIKKEDNAKGHFKEDRKIEEIDAKLKTMEDKIVDDALKYTGAHQDEGDSKEIQEVKDNIISRLAAAYSLEKMRNALEEYQNVIENEKARMKQEGKLPDDYTYEGKRLSVPRKEAIDETRENTDGDNNIKCTSSEDCHEQNYKIPNDILESHLVNVEQCPAIQRACNDIALLIGHYGRVFEKACNMHQMCLLCSNNSWFSPTRQCNVLFLDKAYEMCKGNEQCQKEAQRSIRYMLDVTRYLQVQPSVAEECDTACPDNERLPIFQ